MTFTAQALQCLQHDGLDIMQNQEDQEFSRLEPLDSQTHRQEPPSQGVEKPVLREFGRRKMAGMFTDISPKMSKKMAIASGLAVIGVGAAIAWPLLNATRAPKMDVELTDEKANPVEKAAKVDVSKLDVNKLPEPQTLDEAKFQIALLKNKVAYMDLRLGEANKTVREKLAATEGIINQANAAEVVASVPQAASEPTVPQPEQESEHSNPVAPPPRQGNGGSQNQVAGVADQPPPTPAKKRVAKRVEKPKVQEEVVRVAVVDISPERVVVVDESKPGIRIRVSPGAELPGGATFIGFDPSTRLMKTDQGEFYIPY